MKGIQYNSRHQFASGLNPLQQFIFIDVEFFTSFISWNQSFTRKRVNGRLCLTCDFTGFVNFNKTMLVGRGLRLQCRHHLPDLFHLFCEITYRLRQLIKSDLFVNHTYSLLIVPDKGNWCFDGGKHHWDIIYDYNIFG